MEENVNSCPGNDEAFSSTFLHAIMLEIYFFSKLKPLKPSNQMFSLSPSLYIPTLINCSLSAIVLWRWSDDEYAWSLSYLLSSVSYSIMLFTIMSCWRQSCKHSSVIACMVKSKPLPRVAVGTCCPDCYAVTIDWNCNSRMWQEAK